MEDSRRTKDNSKKQLENKANKEERLWHILTYPEKQKTILVTCKTMIKKEKTTEISKKSGRIQKSSEKDD